jgi:hypothetical protein
MTAKLEMTDHWTDAGRKLFLAEVRVTSEHIRQFPRLMIEVPDQGTLEANIQETRRSLQRFAREIEKALQSPLRLTRDRAMR